MQTTSIQDEITYPLPQPAWLKALAKVLSYLFHPLFIPTYLAAYIIFQHPYAFAVFDEKQKILRLVSVFIITAFFPGITVFLLWRLKFADSIFLRTQKERIIPYVSSIIYFFWAFYVTKNLAGTPPAMVFLFLGIFLSTSAALMANNYFKISMHALGVGGAAAFMILLSIATRQPIGMAITVTTLVAGLVCSARLIVSDHHPAEVYWGIIIGGLSQLVAYWFIT
ncbi:hypothetical protein [Aridibaculum aurantiacum]|uniref:hypothetical protein n=1 Tax=Aridibaculum aurantiacum TaxID=2810307 RepID=UPI001A97528C|nr:hypothetical protein [Aridibaculum aurantiacum]